jgi:hypothetical protein
MATLAVQGVQLQSELIRAAHAAGVGLFVPAEWGNDDVDLPAHVAKEATRAEAAALGVTTTSSFPGVQVDRLLTFDWDFAGGKTSFIGLGRTSISVTGMDDTVRFTVHALTPFSRGQLENAKLHLEGERVVSFLSRSLGRLSDRLSLRRFTASLKSSSSWRRSRWLSTAQGASLETRTTRSTGSYRRSSRARVLRTWFPSIGAYSFSDSSKSV